MCTTYVNTNSAFLPQSVMFCMILITNNDYFLININQFTLCLRCDPLRLDRVFVTRITVGIQMVKAQT
jgi:hypothetical protein